MKRGLGVCVSVCLAVGYPAMAMAAPHLVEHQIVVQGNQNFDVTGINDSGVMVGTLYAAITGTLSGVIVKKQSVTTIPAPYSFAGPPHPTSIYNNGTIIGTVLTTGGFHEMFVSRKGVVDPNYQIVLDYGSPPGFAPLGVNPIGLVGTRVFFTRVISRELPNSANYGTPPHFKVVPRIDTFTTIKGLSASDVASGTAFQERGPQSVFLGKGDSFQSIAPAGAISASGGVSNAAGEVAGSYVDPTNNSHGFVYNAGAYSTFDMAVPASEVVVTAINDKGWVVGTYVSSADNKQHAFFYDGSGVASIGTYDATVGLSAALNNVGQVVIAEQVFDPVPKFVSFLETCHAGSC